MNYEAELSSKMKDVVFEDIVKLVTYKVNASEISLNNYISTDNMLPNCGGITHASSLPSAKKFNAFTETDTLFSNIRTYFRKVWFADFSGGASPDVLIFRSKDKGILDPHFLYYLISNKTFINYTDLTSKGAKMPRGDKDAIAKFPVKIPQINDQKSIASVLGALDDKIENNRQMNETLEEMARSIFKSWFVDFDPVNAKAAGNAPAHMDTETAALFPNSFDDDGLPVGWNEEPLYNIATFINGAAYKNMHFCDPNEGLPVIKIAELKNGISSQTKFTNTDLGEKYNVSAGEIFFAWSGSPQTSINTFIWPHGDGWLNQHIFAIKENGFASLAYVYFQMKLLNPKFVEIATDKQTTGLGHVTVKDMKEMMIVSPPNEVRERFEQIANSLFETIKLNLFESQTLAELRDTLLPKLMSGEIRVKDAELEVEAAV